MATRVGLDAALLGGQGGGVSEEVAAHLQAVLDADRE